MLGGAAISRITLALWPTGCVLSTLGPCLLCLLLLCDVCSYPASVGRNMDEIVRVVDALLLSAEKSVATPANWPNNHADQV